MRRANAQLRIFDAKEKLLEIAAIVGLLEGVFIGLIFGTYFYAKYNAAASLDGGALLGAGISFSLAMIWTAVTISWTIKNTDFVSRLRISGTSALINFTAAWIGYFFSSAIGALGAALLSKMF
ncbi:MAG: hypothetical protein Q7S82_02955 [bacterium]|nr:hypothetical protein [bacterium]